MNAPVQLEPAPGYIIPGVGIPGGPTEQQATDTAVEYGWLIAVVIVGALVVTAVRFVTERINIKLVLVLGVVGFIAYQIGTRS